MFVASLPILKAFPEKIFKPPNFPPDPYGIPRGWPPLNQLAAHTALTSRPGMHQPGWWRESCVAASSRPSSDNGPLRTLSISSSDPIITSLRRLEMDIESSSSPWTTNPLQRTVPPHKKRTVCTPHLAQGCVRSKLEAWRIRFQFNWGICLGSRLVFKGHIKYEGRGNCSLLTSVWLPNTLRASLEPFIQAPWRLPCQVARCRYDRRSRVIRRLL